MAGFHDIPVMQIGYDTRRYSFKTAVENALDCYELPMLHKTLGDVALVDRKSDQATEAHKRFYTMMDRTAFPYIYRHFVKEVVEPLFAEPVVYQRVPTFRVHLPDNKAVGEWHRDRDYNHLSQAVTFWLPVTDAHDTNAVFAELDSQEQCLPVPYGKVMVWDSMNIRHGNRVNETGLTRVSVDFRVIPKSQFEPSQNTTINTGMKMDIGGYYAD